MNNLLSHMTGASRKGKINIVAEMRLKSKNSKLNWQTAKQKIFINSIDLIEWCEQNLKTAT